MSEQLEDWSLGEGDADDALEGDELPVGLVRFQLGIHAPGEPDDAHDANGCGDGLDDAEAGCRLGEGVFERTDSGIEDPTREIQAKLDREDLENHDPHRLGRESAVV